MTVHSMLGDSGHYVSIVKLFADGLQFLVAGYALRLNRLFGTVRVGWSLFCAFTLLAALHAIQSATSGDASLAGLKIEVMYGLVSLLLLTGMAHMEALLKERIKAAKFEAQLKENLQAEVKKKTAHLTRAIEELQSEIDMRKRVEVQMEESNTELFYACQKVKAAETVSASFQKMLNILKSVDTSAGLISGHVKQSKIANVVRIGNLIREHSANLGQFMATDPRGQKLPQYIAQLAEHLDSEQTTLAKELESIKANLKEIMALEKSPANPGVPEMQLVGRKSDADEILSVMTASF